MKTKITNLILALFTISLIYITGCEKKELIKTDSNRQIVNNNNNIEVKNGVLSFKNEDDLYNLMSDLENMSQDEFDKWQTNLNFLSYKGKLDEIYKELNGEDLSYQEFWQIVTEHKKWIKVETDPYGKNSIHPVVEDMGYAAVLNTEGVCIIDSSALKIIGNYSIIAPKNEIDLIRKTNTLEKAKQNKHWLVEQYRFPGEEKAYNLRGSYTYNPSGCKKDRRVFIQMVLLHENLYGGQRRLRLRTRITAERKRFCAWVHYWTSLSAKYVQCSAKVYSSYNECYYDGNVESFNFSSDGDQWSLQKTVEIFSYSDPSTHYYTPQFTFAYGKGTSRGVGDNWATIYYR